jgi:hypothetical protein
VVISSCTRKDIGKVPVVPLYPEVPAGGCFDKLSRHPHPAPGLAHAAFEHVPQAQIAPDVIDRNLFALVSEARAHASGKFQHSLTNPYANRAEREAARSVARCSRRSAPS